MTKSTKLTPHTGPAGIATARPTIDRLLPPAELNARRTRKRNQTHLAPRPAQKRSINPS
jgi:hypothetical protein